MAASINRSTAFALVGFGFVLANLTNVGGEGQIAVGGTAARAVALYGHVSGLPLGLSFTLPMLAVVAGAAWGALAAVMKDQGGHQRGDQHIAAFLHRSVAAVLVRTITRPAPQTHDDVGDPPRITGNSR
jgi:uncharacterized membrane protein